MVENARSVKVKLLRRKLGATETSIVLNMFVRFAFPKYGFKQDANSSKFLRAERKMWIPRIAVLN
jgi:hypothetical protein